MDWSLQQKVESWIRDQRTKIGWAVKWPVVVINWPWTNGQQQRKRIKEEYERRKRQLVNLCHAVKADSLSDLQDILCCMLLSECVYKRPDTELLRSVNKFKADFGSQIVSIDRVQPSSDHVPHRYLLAEAGDTLYASFIGTKQYKDVMVDANILQGAIFHEDDVEDLNGSRTSESVDVDSQNKNADDLVNSHEVRQLKSSVKPAAHRGFMARAKGIPALELYRLAQKKNRKLVLCGHSLGGAVAVLATLAILRVIAASSSTKESEKVQVKCITFSQPPVGNAALRDYVNRKDWQRYFKTYCIPEDLVPRILSPAYFHHYNTQTPPVRADDTDEASSLLMPRSEDKLDNRKPENLRESNGEQLVLGLGPMQSSFWRLSKLVPIEAVRRQIYRFKGTSDDPPEMSVSSEPSGASSIEDVVAAPQSLEIQEDSDGISLKPISEKNREPPGRSKTGKSFGKNSRTGGENRSWRRVPYLPSYVPFGQLYLLGSSSVEALSGAEYSKLTSVKSVLSELRERLQSHSMRSYRSRFQRIFDVCMNDSFSTFLGIDQLQQFPQLQKWLGSSVAGSVELGHIVESPVIRTATSVAPLGWTGIPGEKNADALKVDITGIRLHLCSLVQARVNGIWCSTTVESFPPEPTCTSNHHELKPDIQRIRIVVGPPLKRPPKNQMLIDSLLSEFPSADSNPSDLRKEQNVCASHVGKFICPKGLDDVVVFCTTDFSTIFKEVHVRTRRVQLIGLEGAGKSSLLKAILAKGRLASAARAEDTHTNFDEEGVSGGLCYSDSAGINLQDLSKEVSAFRDKLWMGVRDLSKKIDCIVLVHNLSHEIPRCSQPSAQEQPALSLLLDEAKALGVPWILAITNKYSLSAHQQKAAVDAILQAYRASPSRTEVINSCSHVVPSVANTTSSLISTERDSDAKLAALNLIFAPINLVRRPFQNKSPSLPVEGVSALCRIVQRVLRDHEEAALQELARDRLLLESAREHAVAADAIREAQARANSLTAAAVGGSLGAGLGIVMAIAMGAASALRKP